LRSRWDVLVAGGLFGSVLTACGELRRSADSVRAVHARQDSIRLLGAGAWSDQELLAYVRLVARTLADDGPMIERRSRSVAVKTFGRRVVLQHDNFRRLADSISGGRGPLPPLLSTAMLDAHQADMRSLLRGTGFDLAYVRRTRATLHDALIELQRADAARHSDDAARLLGEMRDALRTHIVTADELTAALTRGR
jgi:predicted outer membrane protein